MNFLLINADQLRHDCVGYRGLRPVRTPNLDALAAESVDYQNAFTPLPVCAPARQAILCGRHPDSFGAQWNFDFMDTPKLPPDWCWPASLTDAGWNTGYLGSFHVHGHNAKEYGYRAFVSAADYRNYVREKYPDVSYTGGWFGCENPVPVEDSQTHWFAGKTCEMIRSFAKEDRPWHVWLDFAEPHLPCRPSGRFAGMYRPEEILPWDGFGDTFEGKPYIHRQQTVSWDTDECCWSDFAPMVARYYGLVSQIDDAVGQILQTLKEINVWEDTVIVFTSDHGDMCGSHNMLDKHYVLYDDIIRVPLLVRVPGNRPRVSDEFVHNCLDVPASLTGWLGLGTPDVCHGYPLPLTEREESGRRSIVCTSNGQQFGLYTTRCIRTEEWKYVWNLTDADELYHLTEDPGEKKNLIGLHGRDAFVREMQAGLLADLEKHNDRFVRSDWIRRQLLNGRKIIER